MLQVSFYIQAPEHSIANYEVTPPEEVARMKEAWNIAEEGWALAKQE